MSGSARSAQSPTSEVGDGYFEERGLRRHAGVWSLWALGVGAVISGDFYGWNFGLSVGGFGGLLLATVVIAIMYYGLCYSIAEMSPALPHTGGAYSFARSAMGPWGGFLTGLAENAEYVITPAVVGGARSRLLAQSTIAGPVRHRRLSRGGTANPFWWAVFYLVFLAINISRRSRPRSASPSASPSSRSAILLVFYVAALVSGKFSPDLLVQHRRRRRCDARRGRLVPAVRGQRHLQSAAVRDLVLPRDRGGPARGRGVACDPSPRRPEARTHPRHAHVAAPQRAARCCSTPGLRRRRRSRSASRAPRCSTGSRRSSARAPSAVLLGLAGARSA